MEEPEAWEDAIDIDDSDLPSLLHPTPNTIPLSLPSLRSCSQTLTPTPRPPPPAAAAAEPPVSKTSPSPRLIPGPAGAVQAAMHRVASAAVDSCFDKENKNAGATDEDDRDFKLNPWLSAMHLLGPGSRSPTISSIKALATTERVSQVVGVVSSCRPNGLGDLIVTLKDPTGTIGATIHSRVLKESSLAGDITVGCVLILKQIVVFSVGRSANYLNVTPNNMVKIICKDCGPLHKNLLPSFAERAPLTQRAETSGDGAGRELNYGRVMSSEKRSLLGSSPCSTSAAVVTNKMAAKVRTREDTENGQDKAERESRLRQRTESATVEVRGNLNCGRPINSAEQAATNRGIADSGCLVRLRGKTTADEPRRAMSSANFETVVNNRNTSPSRSQPYSINAAAATTSQLRQVELEAVEKVSSLMRRSETSGDEANLKYGGMITSGKTGPTGSMPCSVNVAAAIRNTAPTADVTGEVELQTPDKVSAQNHKNEITADVARRSLYDGQTNHNGNLPHSISASVVATNAAPKTDHRSIETKNLISKVSVAQWTDEQLLELFSDYQDDELFRSSI